MYVLFCFPCRVVQSTCKVFMKHQTFLWKKFPSTLYMYHVPALVPNTYIVSLSIINHNQILSRLISFSAKLFSYQEKVNYFIHWCWIVYIFSVNIHWNLEKVTFSTYHWLQPITTCSDVRFVVEILTYRAACIY